MKRCTMTFSTLVRRRAFLPLITPHNICSWAFAGNRSYALLRTLSPHTCPAAVSSSTRSPSIRRSHLPLVTAPMTDCLLHGRRQLFTAGETVEEVGTDNGGCGLPEAEALLRERFGPQAKLVLRRCQRRHSRNSTKAAPHGEEEEEVVEDDEPVGGGASFDSEQSKQEQQLCGVTEYRASATCRLLGFPLELAVASGGEAKEVLHAVLNDALESDVVFIHPQQRASASSHGCRGTGRNRGYQKRGSYRKGKEEPTLSPRQLELKAIIDELRELCVHFSRVLKFSIKSPRNSSGKQGQESEQGADLRWRCRAYERDEWGMTPSLSFSAEARGQSANDSLVRCLAMLRDRYRAELESPSVQLESVREVEVLVRPWEKIVESHCFEECTEGSLEKEKGDSQRHDQETPSPSSPSPVTCHGEGAEPTEPIPVEEQYRVLRAATFTAAVTVEDARGNISVHQVKRQATPLVAYQNASLQALRAELTFSPDANIATQLLPSSPLLVRMRWQFDAMVQHLSREYGKKTEDIALVRVEGDGAGDDKERDISTAPKDGDGDQGVPPGKHRYFFTASFTSDGCVVWQQSGPGRYRLEFDCYVQALTYLLDQYPEVGRVYFDPRGGGVFFPTTQLLSLAVQKHDNYNVATNHRGKWNAYALLGTLTSQLIGSFYQTTYHTDRATGEATAVLTVDDGLRSNQLLIERRARKRGEAWRNACLDALRENFPNQYRDALLLHPDIDLSGDTMARGSKFRALPREKRVEHMGNIFSLVSAFAEEDLGWHNLRVRLRNASGDLGLPQWVAEMEAQVEGEEQRRVVAVSPPYPQVKHARRVLVYSLAKKYFPKELEAYAKLNRGDAVNPDQDAQNVYNSVFRVGSESFVHQVMLLLEEQAPSMAPFTWSLEQQESDGAEEEAGNDGSVEYLLRPFRARFRAAVCGQKGDLLVSERIGEEGESAACVLCSALRAATNRLAGDKGEQLWTEYECHAPPPITNSRELSLYMFNTFFGVSTGTATAIEDDGASPSTVEQQVVDIDARELGGYWFVTLSFSRAGGLAVARAVATSKREGVRDVLLLACRQSFPRALTYLSAHSKEIHSFAEEILTAPVVEVLPAAVLRDLQRQLERAESAGPPRPYTLLRRCVTREFRNERWLRVEQQPSNGGGFQCRIYLQRHRRETRKGEVQLVGFGAALTRAQALHIASLRALENLFEQDLADAIARSPTYTDLPPLE
ncbi:hypothetical protein, conserved [Trypanosoma brucei gambiense DAL972]|uniref:DRBM domain-containing protein n=2 Tax=Trypanosoma brucei TaxID=5691 RepID=C9ZL92_TRYB9|nr:hypothetical protein, conserved [Trypanosoma brucei gambiense DAL972]CBH10101.1 hypothetical protein, conserved [Trypanosoma brucei gambiense DAL972]|eukprot:XP_011772391.1 hypothetical protein, conserved [Trypanosoma brucei gambiense DAL972]